MSLQIRAFRHEDIEPALSLCRAAGWNQLHSDWARILSYEQEGCFVAEIDARLAGTVTSTRYSDRLGWIGMMLVDPEFRRRGIATALMESCVEYLRRAGTQCIKLDATPAGQLVYERLGFRSEWSFHRWQRESDSPNRFPDSAVSETAGWIEEITSLDGRAFGVDRTDWLRRLARDSFCVRHDDGFGMGRRGHVADYLGPVTAADECAAETIIAELLSRAGGNVFWDIPSPNEAAVGLAERFGFQPIRDLTRMWLGSSHRPRVDLQYALCDPGTG